MQRNHSLFGSVWSSIRRRGQNPFRRSKNQNTPTQNGKPGVGDIIASIKPDADSLANERPYPICKSTEFRNS